MREYRIREDKRSAQAVRKAARMALKLAGGVVLIFLLLMGFVENGSQLLELIQWHWFLIIVAGVFGLRYVQELNLATAIVYMVGEERILKAYQAKKLNAGNKYGISKQERRYGAKAVQEIKIKDIRSLQVSDKKIKILSKDYNFFNSNGMIEIPAGVEGFEQLKLKIEDLRAVLKLG